MDIDAKNAMKWCDENKRDFKKDMEMAVINSYIKRNILWLTDITKPSILD